MIYNLSDKQDLLKAWTRIKKFMFEGKTIEIKEVKNEHNTTSDNNRA